jgi:hypothetical protein
MNANNLSILYIVLHLISFITKDEEVEPDAEEAGDDENADDEGKRLLNDLVQGDSNAPHHTFAVLPVTALNLTIDVICWFLNTTAPSRSTSITTSTSIPSECEDCVS